MNPHAKDFVADPAPDEMIASILQIKSRYRTVGNGTEAESALPLINLYMYIAVHGQV